MILYGIRIHSDIKFPSAMPKSGEYRKELYLNSEIPHHLQDGEKHMISFYETHDRKVQLLSNQSARNYQGRRNWCYNVEDVISFFWQSGNNQIYYRRNRYDSDSLLEFWFIHLFLPLYSTLENICHIIHGSAVVLDNSAIIFMAPSMGGKSTLCDYFINRGHALISDDKIPLFLEKGTFHITGAHPYHRPYRKYEDLGRLADNYSNTFSPAHAVYFLEPVKSREDVMVNTLKGAAKFDLLTPHLLYTFNFLPSTHFSFVSDMLSQINAFRISIPRDKKRLDEVYRTIHSHSSGLAARQNSNFH